MRGPSSSMKSIALVVFFFLVGRLVLSKSPTQNSAKSNKRQPTKAHNHHSVPELSPPAPEDSPKIPEPPNELDASDKPESPEPLSLKPLPLPELPNPEDSRERGDPELPVGCSVGGVCTIIVPCT